MKNNLEQTQENVRTPKISYNESKNKRNHYSAEFKTKVVLETLRPFQSLCKPLG